VVFETDMDFNINYIENNNENDLCFLKQFTLNSNIFDISLDDESNEIYLEQKFLLQKHIEIRSFIFEIMEETGKKYYSLSVRPFFTEDKNFKGFRGVISDVTSRKEYENKIAEQKEQIKQIQKMDAIGELTAGIAHDFNNVLSVISASLKNISKIELEHDGLNKYLIKAINACEKGTKLSKRLLSFSRRQESEEKAVVLNEAIESLSEILTVALSSSTRFTKDFSADLWETKIDINMLENVLINMCVNARDALSKSDDPEVIMKTRNVNKNNKEMVLIEIKDNGEGMPEDVKNKVFQPFFTTKEKDKGTGLGLSMVYNFVKQYKGEIELESSLGSGTIFRLYLPRYQA
jgi:signal transduction histidine kinase